MSRYYRNNSWAIPSLKEVGFKKGSVLRVKMKNFLTFGMFCLVLCPCVLFPPNLAWHYCCIICFIRFDSCCLLPFVPCVDECEVFPGPRLNVVLGPNGTGKSPFFFPHLPPFLSPPSLFFLPPPMPTSNSTYVTHLSFFSPHRQVVYNTRNLFGMWW